MQSQCPVTAHVAVVIENALMETDVSKKCVNVEEMKDRLLALVEEKQPVFV